MSEIHINRILKKNDGKKDVQSLRAILTQCRGV
jgi:hypothetical protein